MRCRIGFYVPSSVWFVPMNLSRCLSSPDESAVECVGAIVKEALAAGKEAAEKASRLPAKPVDWWQG